LGCVLMMPRADARWEEGAVGQQTQKCTTDF
jgi:hypothetical protein